MNCRTNGPLEKRCLSRNRKLSTPMRKRRCPSQTAVSMVAPGAIHVRLQGAEGDILGNKHTVSVAPSAGRCKLPLAHRALSENVQCGNSRQWEPLTILQNHHSPRSTTDPKETTTSQLSPTVIPRVEDTVWRIPKMSVVALILVRPTVQQGHPVVNFGNEHTSTRTDGKCCG